MQTSSRIDEQIVRLIAERGRFVAQAAAFKKNAHAEMIEALYREMIRRFVDMEMREFESGTASAQ